MTTGVTRVLPCSAQDEQRFRELGVPASKLFLTGNIKLDVRITPLADAARAQLRRELGLPEGLVLLGSSTWPGEEAAVLEAWRAARAAGVKVSLLIVPRHAERRGEIERLLREAGVRFHFRSTGAASGEVDVAVGDTTGELRNFTQLADLVFVGKSLAPHTEGQTPVEAAVLGRPILFGPGMGNFRLLARDLVARGAAREVADSLALTEAVVGLLQNPSARAALSAAAAKWHRENTGALERTLAIIREEIGSVRSVGR
jgi:3-deoxy-D-manno-octulosonic-acid transferase